MEINTNIFNKSTYWTHDSNQSFSLRPDGDKVAINRTDNRHYGKTNSAVTPDQVAGTFGDVLRKAFEEVNDQQVVADEMTQKLVYDPNSVDIHDVMVSAEKARMSLTFTKSMADGFIRAYRELTSLR
ncbi:flagellar hook-basal body complex protein FliE [Leptospira sp. GIMC2001]|uniref:flagellar hook-basal body complex protein FliE n=1 Tax=Leptospira sp. GIMC2001 TaxID=1513297 RepID=UPI0004A5C566|nr:flagellar hook-basal body complex protein FliE [Leptospira sp. GIMC2001]AID56238.1 flagellar hook-basal body complex protein FliE [Leptospira sp. GIMC2001]WCL48250.1 flagellar hook-basal body complex protein FliE [Leptospira sp. GIMC2001]